MQSRLVTYAACVILILIASDFSSGAALSPRQVPDWRKVPMVFPCGGRQNVNTGEGFGMIFNCPGEVNGPQGSGVGGGAGGSSRVDADVKAHGMVFAPSATRRPTVQNTQRPASVQRVDAEELD